MRKKESFGNYSEVMLSITSLYNIQLSIGAAPE